MAFLPVPFLPRRQVQPKNPIWRHSNGSKILSFKRNRKSFRETLGHMITLYDIGNRIQVQRLLGYQISHAFDLSLPLRFQLKSFGVTFLRMVPAT